MRPKIVRKSSGSLADLSSLIVLVACTGARLALDVAESAVASLLEWSGAVDAIGGVLAREPVEEGGAS